MNDWINEWMHEWINEWMNECMNEWINKNEAWEVTGMMEDVGIGLTFQICFISSFAYSGSPWFWHIGVWNLYLSTFSTTVCFFHDCKILWPHDSKSSRDNWLLKKVPGSYERCIYWCVTPRTFWQKSEPLDTGRNVDQKQ